MRQLFTIVLGVAIVGSLLFGCKGGDGPQGPAGPALTGNLIGYIELANEDHSYPVTRSGVTVTVPGSAVSAVTDSTGRFVLAGLTIGTIDIVCNKSGYAESRVVSVPFTGGTFVLNSWWGTITLDRIPTFEVATAVVTAGGGTINVTGTINSTVSWYRYALIYAGKTASISISNPSSYSYVTSAYIGGGTNAFNLGGIYRPSLDQAGFVSGQTVYFAVVSAGGQYWASGYPDASSGNYVYTCMGTTVKTGNAILP